MSISKFLANSLDDGYCRKQFGNSVPAENICRVFVGRRNFLNVCQYIDKMPNIGENILQTIYSEIGIRVAVKRIAEEFFYFFKNSRHKNTKLFSYGIIIFSDVFVYGRTLEGLLDDCEEIFADTYYLKCSDYRKQYDEYLDRKQLYDIFLSLVRIDVECRNENSGLLKMRYQERIIPKGRVSLPDSWRKSAYEIAESAFCGDVPNEIFVPSLKFRNNFSRFDLADAFAESQAAGLLSDFRRVKNRYRGRCLDNYIAVFSERDTVKFVFTVRCTRKYIMPFVFLPALSRQQHDRIMEAFFERASSCRPVLECRRNEWDSPQLSMVYAQLFNMVVTTVFMRAFFAEFGTAVNLNDILPEKPGNMTAFNYAHDREIAGLLNVLLDPEQKPWFSLSELRTLLSDVIGTETYIFKGISDITRNENAKIPFDLRQKIECVFEKSVFDYGIASEKSAYTMLKSCVPPSYASVRYFSFPLNNPVGNMLRKIYAYKGSWMRRNISLHSAFSYMFQIMDWGGMSLIVGNYRGEYVQCFKTEELSVDLLLYRYALYLPLLNEIQWRCRRQGRNTPAGLYYEFNYFFDACRVYGEKNLDDMTYLENIRRQFGHRLIYIVYQLLTSGQNCDDYMYLVGKKLAYLNVRSSPGDYIRDWKNLYVDIVY